MLEYVDRENIIRIETDALQAAVRTEGYVSGTMAGELVDKASGHRDPGMGLHIMDFLLAPGWRDDGYTKDPLKHGDQSKHYVEGPQICTKAERVDYEIFQGDEHLAIKQWHSFTAPGEGYSAGSLWEQTLLFFSDARYFISCETVTCENSVQDLFYRIDMPGHLKHDSGDSFEKIYLSYHGLIDSMELSADFPPDERFLYTRNQDMIPDRFIRAYQLRGPGGPGPWVAGMTLDPGSVCEAWCHQRGYVCFIQELHRRSVCKGETIGAAYIVGYFDSIDSMNRTFDRYKGVVHIEVSESSFNLLDRIPQIV